MSRRRNGTNRAAAQLGLNRHKLGKQKPPGLCAAGKEIHYRYDPVTGQYRAETSRENTR